MNNYRIYIGLNDKNTKKQEINTLDAFKITTNLLIEYFGGWTINEGNWVYTHDNWEIVIEKTLICSLSTNENIDKFIKDCKKIFNQESIMIEKINSEISFN